MRATNPNDFDGANAAMLGSTINPFTPTYKSIIPSENDLVSSLLTKLAIRAMLGKETHVLEVAG